MQGSSKARSSRALTVVLVALAASLVSTTLEPPSALAGTYAVTACEATPDGHTNNSWWQSSSGWGYYTVTGCPNDAGGHRQGMLAQSGLGGDVGVMGLWTAGWTRFDAPAGTTIASVQLDYDGRSYYPNTGWSSYVASSDNGFSGSLATGNSHFDFLDGCTAFAFCSSYFNNRIFSLPGGTTSVSATIECDGSSGCNTGSSGAYVALHSARVTLQDNSGASMTNFRGLWGNTNWVRGTQHVGFDASDASGVKVAAIEIDPGTPQGFNAVADTRPCDYTYAVPCPQQGIATDFDTTRVGDGAHTMRFVTVDAAGNFNTADTTIYVDNHAPARPNVTADPVAQPGGWASSPSWTLRWNTPDGQTSDVTATHWKVCQNGGAGPCSTFDSTLSAGGSGLSGGSNARADDFNISQPGDYTVQLWLGDQAGNADPNTASDPVHVKFDNVAPGMAAPAHANGWLNAQEAASYPERITLDQGAQLPVSGVAGYAVTTDGSNPGTTINAPATSNVATFQVHDLPEGHNTIKARAVSGAGYASASVDAVDLPVDKSPPSVSAQGAPDATVWQNHDVPLTFIGSDQPGLSGMTAAAAAQPVTAGAYMTYAIDGGPEQQVRGGTAPVTINTEGVHHVTYQAYDLAGNSSTQRSVDLRIDKTPPGFVAFEDQDPSNPARVSVAASDATSGLADGGVIQLRPASPALAKRALHYQDSTGCTAKVHTRRCRAVMHTVRKQFDSAATGDWASLSTGRTGDHYNAELTPSAAPTAGLYQFRAVVPDQAGNQAIGSATRDGDPVELYIDPAKLGDPGGTGSGTSSTQGAHCFGCPSYPTATVVTELTARLVKPAAKKGAKKPRTKAGGKGAHRKVIATAKRKRTKRTPARAHTTSREQLVGSLLVGFGKGATAKGTLRYATGQAIAGATVDVYAQLDAAGSKWTHIAAVRTDAQGAFRYKMPAGPSRAMGFRYDGNARDRAAEAKVTVKVPAATTIKASKRRLRLRQTLTLKGRLKRLGAPVPAAGKLIVLEAFDRRRWRKFATVRANKTGAWRYRYRFVATRGTVTYPMRAVVVRDSSYAFETGTSKAVHVTVKGR